MTPSQIKMWFRSGVQADITAVLADIMDRLMPDHGYVGVSSRASVTTFTPSGRPVITRRSERITTLAGGNGASDELGQLSVLLAMIGRLAERPYKTDLSGLA